MTHRTRDNREGIALILALFAGIIIFGAVAVVVHRVHSAKRFTDESVTQVRLDEICKAGIDLAIEQVWNDYIEGNGNTTGNLASYRLFANGVLPNNEDINLNGQQDPGEFDFNGDGQFNISQPAEIVSPNSPYIFNQNGESGGQIDRLQLFRTDDVTGSMLTIVSTGRVGTSTRVATQTVRVSGQPFSGFEFAVLANNVNCILCHADFRALDLEYNTDDDLYGSFDRIKIATLESLLLRTTEADSLVAGTAYTRGEVTNESGTLLSPNALASSTFKGWQFSSEHGKITQDPNSGALSVVPLVNAGTNSEGLLNQFANLYRNYPTENEYMTDGPLPNNFPAPYPDLDEDRYVSDGEFNPIMNSATGSITGGIVYGVPDGATYNQGALPTSSNGAVSDVADGTYDGNLILVGTDQNPVQINGRIAVNGDLVIKGKVKGYGQLLVRRNAYVVGDVTYADAPGQFGKASDGTENAMALVSGGSILMGDYLTIRGKQHTQDTAKFPDKAFSIDTRTANRSGTKKINGVTQTLNYGYFDPGVIDAGVISPTMVNNQGQTVTRQGQQYSFTTSELMLFNNLELEKAVADASYTPRFYGLREGQADKIYVYDSPDEHAVRYDESGSTVKNIVDYMIAEGMDMNILNRAAFHYMNPEANWISESTLRQIWWNDEQSRPSSGRPFQFDGLLYSNNAIFAITRSRARHKSYADGKMLLRGGIICPDLGVLVPSNEGTSAKGLTMLYDRRVRAFYQLEDTTQVAFNRLVYRYGDAT